MSKATKNQCPTCANLKDVRAKQCRACRVIYQPPARKGTGAPFRIAANGYVMIMVNGIECYKHRVVTEEYLGRPLSSDEHVHHCDKDKTNNDIENLELMLHGTHACHHMLSGKAKQMSVLGHKKRWNYVSNI